MAAGVPVIGTDVLGIRDVVRDGENGLMVPAGDSGRLAAAIERIVRDSPLRARLVDGGTRDVRARFTWDAVIGQYRELLRV